MQNSQHADKNRAAEPGQKNQSARLPAYAKTQIAYHQAFAPELRRVIRSLPIASTQPRVLDLPCGDGFFTAALARRLPADGMVTAADHSTDYLSIVRRRVAHLESGARIEIVRADAYDLPFDDASFDLVWCAESMISLDDPVAALKEMRRVTRPGGKVAVLEDDEFHRVLVNWPVSLELDVQRALAAAAREKYRSAAGLSPARRLRRLFQSADLQPVAKRTFAADRMTPFCPRLARFLKLHFADTRAFISPHLTAEQLATFDAAVDPAHESSIFRRDDAEVTALTTLFLAERSRTQWT